jgi:hypothetical protein
MLLGWLAASVVSGFHWLVLSPEHGGVVAISFGLGEGFITSLLVVVLGGILHFALDRVGLASRLILRTNRTMVMGMLGGLAGGLLGLLYPGAGG